MRCCEMDCAVKVRMAKDKVLRGNRERRRGRHWVDEHPSWDGGVFCLLYVVLITRKGMVGVNMWRTLLVLLSLTCTCKKVQMIEPRLEEVMKGG